MVRRCTTLATALGAILTTVLLISACGPQSNAGARVVVVATTRCGTASPTSGVGVIVDDDLVLTAAHVVVGAGSVTISDSERESERESASTSTALVAEIVLVDATRDLALLRVPNLLGEPVELGTAVAGDLLVAPLPGARRATAIVRRAVAINIDDVRASTRSRRAGYELRGALVPGDSGAGLFDDEDRLVGIFFSRSVSRDVVFAVGATEIATVLSALRMPYVCDLDASRVVLDE